MTLAVLQRVEKKREFSCHYIGPEALKASESPDVRICAYFATNQWSFNALELVITLILSSSCP